MKKQTRMAGLALAGLFVATGATAAGVTLETPITYAKDASVNETVRTECRIEDMLEKYVTAAVGRVKPAAANEGAVLKLEITHVLGVGGGAWSGPKAITVDAKLMVDGKVQRQSKVNRWTTGGVWGGFKGTCSILERSAQAIGKDMARWVKDSRYVMPVEAEPAKEAAAATAPAEGAASDAAAATK